MAAWRNRKELKALVESHGVVVRRIVADMSALLVYTDLDYADDPVDAEKLRILVKVCNEEGSPNEVYFASQQF